MSEKNDGTENLECGEIVYRALKRACPEEPIPPEAFIRKIRLSGPTPGPELGVSLSRKKYSTARECRTILRKMSGCASLHVGKVRDLPLNLDIWPDPEFDESSTVIIRPGHCLLMNLPDPKGDEENAEYAATQLLRLARCIAAEQEEIEHVSRRPTNPSGQ
jgi:hypothetical protein